MVPDDFDLFVGEQALLQDFLGAQAVTAVDQIDLAGEVGQKQGLLDRRIAAADDRHFLAAIEEAVAGGAGGYAEALEFHFAFQPQPFGLGAGADDQDIAAIFPAAVAAEAEGTGGKIRLHDGVGNDIGADLAGLFLHLFHQPRSLNRFGETGIILDLGGDGELPARLHTVNQPRFQRGAGGIDGGGQPGRAGPQDENLAVCGFAHDILR